MWRRNVGERSGAGVQAYPRGRGWTAVRSRCRAQFSGRVQGVFFRATTRTQAQTLGLTGWVRNREDGSVEALFEGPKETVQQLLAFCKSGIPRAHVERLVVDWSPATGEFTTFEIVE